MHTLIRSRAIRVYSALLVATAATSLDAGEAAGEAALGAMSRAWWATTISMPATTALLEPRMVQAPPHREAEVITAAVRALSAAPLAQPEQPPLRVYPEAVILRALRHGDRAFGRCWSRARQEAVETPRKARLHLEVDAAGVVQIARTGEGRAEELRGLEGDLPSCIARVGLRLPFPALGQPVKLSLLLLH